jgi:hypothetical protein
MMNAQHAAGIAAIVCLASISATTAVAASAPDVVPQKQSLVIPVGLAADRSAGASPAQCVVNCGPVAPVSAVAFSPDGKTLAAAGYRETLLWDLENARLARRLGAGQMSGSGHSIAFSKDGSVLAVGEGAPRQSGAVRVFDVRTGQLTRSLQEPRDVVYGLALSPDGKLIAAGSADGSVYVWGLPDGKLLTTIKEHGDWVLGVSFSPDGKLLATGGADRTVQVWEVGTWKSINKLPQPETVHGVSFSPDGELLAAAVGGPDAAAVRVRKAADDPETKVPGPRKAAAAVQARQTRVLDTGGGMPLAVEWAPDGRWVYAACSDNTVKVFNASGSLLAALAGHSDWVYSVALTPDGAKLASGSADGTVRLWTAPDGRPLATLAQLGWRTDEWLIVTPQGHLVTSTASAIEWRAAGPTTRPQQLAPRLPNPERVKDALAGKKPGPTPTAPPATTPRRRDRPDQPSPRAATRATSTTRPVATPRRVNP